MNGHRHQAVRIPQSALLMMKQLQQAQHSTLAEEALGQHLQTSRLADGQLQNAGVEQANSIAMNLTRPQTLHVDVYWVG